jgi:hypothetical protein
MNMLRYLIALLPALLLVSQIGAFKPGFGIQEAVEQPISRTRNQPVSAFQKRTTTGNELIMDINDHTISEHISKHAIYIESSTVADLDLEGADGTPLIWHETTPQLPSCGDHGHGATQCSFRVRENQAHFSTGYVHQLETNDVDHITTKFTAEVMKKTLIPTEVHPTLAYVPLILSSKKLKSMQIQYILVGPDTYPDFETTDGTTTTNNCEIPDHVILGNGTGPYSNQNFIVGPTEKIIACTEYVITDKFRDRKIMWDLKINFFWPPDEGIIILPIFPEASGEYRVYVYEKEGRPINVVHNIGSLLGDGWDAYTLEEQIYQFAVNELTVNGYQWDNELHARARADPQPAGGLGFARFCPPMQSWKRKVDEWSILFGNKTDSFDINPATAFACIIEKCDANEDPDCCFMPCEK